MAKLPIHRKLKDYIYNEEHGCTVIFGDLMSTNCVFSYEDNGVWKEWSCKGTYGHEMDFLLNYYVVGIHPMFKLDKNKIVVYNHITLKSLAQFKAEEVELHSEVDDKGITWDRLLKELGAK